MEQQQAFLVDLFTSTDDRKKLLGLAILQRDAAEGCSSLPMLHPLVLRQFIVQPKSDKAGHFLGRKLAYMLMRTMPVYGSAWVSLANAIDRDVQAASISGEESPLIGEIGVYAMRTVLAMPFTHIEEYVRSRWEAVLAAVSMAKNLTLRLCGIDALTIYATPPAGMERHEMILFVRRIVMKPRFAEVLRRLLLDPHEDVSVRGFQLLSVLQMTANSGEQTTAGTPALVVSSTPLWLMHALGLTVDVCQEITNRAGRLPLGHQQCILAPLTALTLAAARLHGPSISLVLTLCDGILRPSLHTDWNEGVVMSAAVSLLSIVAQQGGLLISLNPHLTMCCEKVLIVVHQHLDHMFETVTLQSSLARVEETNLARSRAELPSGVLEALFSLLSVLPHAHRVRHCQSLLSRCSTAQRKHPITLVDSAENFLPTASFLHPLALIVARVLSTTLMEVSANLHGVAATWCADAQGGAAIDESLDSCARYLGGFLRWCGENTDCPMACETYSQFLRCTAGQVVHSADRARQLLRQLVKASADGSKDPPDELFALVFYVSNVLRLLSNHTMVYFPTVTHILVNPHFRSILASITELFAASSGLKPAAKLPSMLCFGLRHVLEEFELAVTFVEDSLSSVLEESMVASMTPSLSPTQTTQLSRLLHVLAFVSLSYVVPAADSIIMHLRRSGHHGIECAVLPSETLSRVAVSLTTPALMFTGTETGVESPTKSSVTAPALKRETPFTPEFIAEFSLAMDTIKLLYTASLRLSELRQQHGNEGPAVTFVHEKLLPHWAMLREEMGRQGGAGGVFLSLIANANREIEEFAFSEDPREIEFQARQWIARALAFAPLFLPPTACWSEGPLPPPRRIQTKTVTGAADPVQVTLSYIVLPTEPMGYMEVAACVTNMTSFVLQQIHFQFTSFCTALHDDSNETVAELHVRYSHEPKRSLFQATLDAAAPSSSSHIHHRGRGCFTITSFPPRASAILTGVYVVYRRLAKPIVPVAAAAKRPPTLASPSMRFGAISGEAPLRFGCRVEVCGVSKSSKGGTAGTEEEEDLVAVAQRAGTGGDDGDDTDEDDAPSGSNSKKRKVVVLPQQVVACEIALQHLFFHPSHLNLPVPAATVATGILALLRDHQDESDAASSLLPFVTSHTHSESWARTILLSSIATARGAFPLDACGTTAPGWDRVPGWVACLPTSWIAPSDCLQFSPLPSASFRATLPVTRTDALSTDHFSVELARDADTKTVIGITARCTSRVWGSIIIAHPEFYNFLNAAAAALQQFEANGNTS